MKQSAEYFKENHYIKVSNFISKDEASFFYDYIKLAANRLSILENKQSKLSNNDHGNYGTFDDEQAPGDYSRYGDLVFDTLLTKKLLVIEEMTGLELIPTYSYHRLYTTGTELKRHKDRPSCEISTTLCLGYDTSNLSDTNWDWPMFVGPNTGEEGTEGISINMKPGDMIIYRGCNLEHWREPFEGINHAQVFLHYNTKNNGLNQLNDTRISLGLPASYGTNRK